MSEPTNSTRSQRLLCCGAVFLVTLDLSLLAIALPSINQHFASTPDAHFAWLFMVFNLLVALLLLPAGWLADRYHRKGALVIGLTLFGLGCLLCGSAATFAQMLGGRALQALGGAFMLPSSLAIMLNLVPTQRNQTVALWGAVASIAAALGPLIGGGLLQLLGWQGVFWANGCCAIVIALLCLRTLASAPLGMPTNQTPELFDRRVFTNPNFLISGGATVLFVAGFSAWLVATPIFLSGVWGYSGLDIGLAILPAPLTSAAMAPVAARLADRYGSRFVVCLGAASCTLALVYWCAVMDSSAAYWTLFVPGAVLMGAGVGFSFPMLTAAALQQVPPSLLALAAAGNTTLRQIGMGLGASLGAGLAAAQIHTAQQGWLMGCALFIGAGLVAFALHKPAHTLRNSHAH